MSGWELIYSSNLPHRIEIVIDALSYQDIKSFKIDKRDSANIILGEIELYTQIEDAILAKIIIQQNQL